MRSLILQAVDRLGEKAAEVFSHREELESVTGKHRNTLTSVPSKELPQTFEAWYADFLSIVVQQFFDRMKKNLQISADAAERTEVLAQSGLPLTPQSRSTLLFETALHCGITAPEISARMMLQAFEITPDLLKNSNLDYLKGFVYEPEKHPQAEFTHCPVCGGEGTPYRTTCSCYINSFDPMFLPAKLWMRCPDCGTLYTRWFPKEFLALGQTPHLVYPREGWMAVQGANTTLLRSWNEILNDVRALSPEGGTSLLEVGVGNGHLIAVAQEMGYQVTAVEILEQAAQETAVYCGYPHRTMRALFQSL
ncbi:MAG TPA: hypothetical protein H9909_14740 [Candidatus Mediterraneibacter norfolkensis]|nr:hypothetical protein [Candidatus Mediterraneibacter norfolkensis]